MKRLSYGLFMLLLLSLGCTEEKTSYYVCPGHLEDGATVDLSEPDVTPDVGEDLAEDTAGSILATGSSCESNDQCHTGSCFCGPGQTEDCFSLEGIVKSFNPQSDWADMVPGGMCSKFMCNVNKSELDGAECGPGAYCFNVEPLLGAPVGLCVKHCDEYEDCRYDEGYVCYFTGVEGQRACLPAKMMADITCGDGKCDAPETKDTCPRDCQ